MEAEIGAMRPRREPGASRSWKRQGWSCPRALGGGMAPLPPRFPASCLWTRQGGFNPLTPVCGHLLRRLQEAHGQFLPELNTHLASHPATLLPDVSSAAMETEDRRKIWTRTFTALFFRNCPTLETTRINVFQRGKGDTHEL